MLTTTQAVLAGGVWFAAVAIVWALVHGAEKGHRAAAGGVRITSACSSCGMSRAQCLTGTADAPCCAACASRYTHDGGQR
ncbi:hypothetical protein GCM10027047_01340 [Rhodococcus aerolatus]